MVTWQSKVKQHNKPVSFSFAKLYGDTGQCRLTITGDGQKRLDGMFDINKTIRIPALGKARDWQIAIETTIAIDLVGLFTSAREVL